MGRISLWKSPTGAATIETALLLVLIVILAASAVNFFGVRVGGLADQVADGSDGHVSETTAPPSNPGGGGDPSDGPSVRWT